jgi:hypothetical protein
MAAVPTAHRPPMTVTTTAVLVPHHAQPLAAMRAFAAAKMQICAFCPGRIGSEPSGKGRGQALKYMAR